MFFCRIFAVYFKYLTHINKKKGEICCFLEWIAYDFFLNEIFVPLHLQSRIFGNTDEHFYLFIHYSSQKKCGIFYYIQPLEWFTTQKKTEEMHRQTRVLIKIEAFAGNLYIASVWFRFVLFCLVLRYKIMVYIYHWYYDK